MTSAADLDRLVDSWSDREGLSQHLRLELAAGDLGPGDPVPGCSCPRCVTLAAGGDEEDADVAAFVVHSLADRPPQERLQLAADLVAVWEKVGSTLPRPGVLAELAKRVPGAVRSLPDDADPLPVEEARRVPIVDVVRRLGLGEPQGRYGEPKVRCAFHNDRNPSMRLNTDRGLWYCDVCGTGGDHLELVMRARRMEFPEAVRFVAEIY